MYQQTVWQEQSRQFERFNELTQLADLLGQTCAEGEALYSGFTHIVGDVWAAFYYASPVMNPLKKQLLPLQYDMLKKIVQTEEYTRWQRLTVGDDLMAVLTTVSIAEQLKKWLKDSAEARQLKRQEERIAAQQQKLQQGSSPEHQKLHQQFMEKQLTAAKRERDAAQEKLERTMAAMPMGGILEETKKEVRDLKQTVVQMGTLDGKKLEQVPIADQFQLAEQIRQHETLKRIAEMTGRFRRIAKKKQKSKEKMTMERKYITMGQEVSRLLPVELAHFVLPQVKTDFLRRYAEQQTLVFDTKGADRKGRGPIIICMDESSSMTTIKAESKAFCLALLMIACKQKRDFAIIPFATDIGEVTIFPKGRSSAAQITAFSQSFLGGGTNYEKPLRASLDILQKSEFNEADILFVTDGSSFLSSRFLEEFNAAKKKRKFECTSIVLTNLINTVDLNIVNQFSDKVIEVNELFEAEDIFAI